jgi:uridine kinase
LRAQGRDVIRATIDDFLFPRTQRYPRGECSAEGCYFDTHDHGALNRVLLDPLGPGGDRRFQYAVYDRTADTALSSPVTTAPADAVLVFDGVFLMRPELIDRWDLRIFVSTALEKTVDRAVIRQRRVSSRAEVERRWRERYIPSQQFYFATVRPTDHVDIIVHNDERAPAAGLGDPNTLTALNSARACAGHREFCRPRALRSVTIFDWPRTHARRLLIYLDL